MTDALINLRVPAATKGRWVRASRAAGQRLTQLYASKASAERAVKREAARLQA